MTPIDQLKTFSGHTENLIAAIKLSSDWATSSYLIEQLHGACSLAISLGIIDMDEYADLINEARAHQLQLALPLA